MRYEPFDRRCARHALAEFARQCNTAPSVRLKDRSAWPIVCICSHSWQWSAQLPCNYQSIALGPLSHPPKTRLPQGFRVRLLQRSIRSPSKRAGIGRSSAKSQSSSPAASAPTSMIPFSGGTSRFAHWWRVCRAKPAEFIRARVSQVARDSHAPFGSEHCKPNLVVVVTNDPDLLLEKWNKRFRGLFNTLQRFGAGQKIPALSPTHTRLLQRRNSPRPAGREWARSYWMA